MLLLNYMIITKPRSQGLLNSVRCTAVGNPATQEVTWLIVSLEKWSQIEASLEKMIAHMFHNRRWLPIPTPGLVAEERRKPEKVGLMLPPPYSKA